MISKIAARLRNYRDYSRSVMELRQMDDHMLADIGLQRGQIDRAVRLGR